MRIVLFGPPGAGKGTQAKLLCDRHQIKHISTGDLLRKAIREDSDIGHEVKEYVRQGKLVADDVVWRLALPVLDALGESGFILDGYPRTVQQARWLTEYLDRHSTSLNAVISFEIDPDIIINRLAKRRVNRLTGENYHLDYKPPPAGVHPEHIIQREDDKPESIRRRLDIYSRETEPVKGYYAKLGLLHTVDSVGDVEEVYERIQRILEVTSEKEG